MFLTQAILSPFTCKLEQSEYVDLAAELEEEEDNVSNDDKLQDDAEDTGELCVEKDLYELNTDADKDDIDQIIQEVQEQHALSNIECKEGCCALTKVL